MIIETLSTFPHMFDSVMNASIMGRAQKAGILQFTSYDLRDWTHDRHRTTDDDPYGGGNGLVMKCEPIFEAYDEIAARLPVCEGFEEAGSVVCTVDEHTENHSTGAEGDICGKACESFPDSSCSIHEKVCEPVSDNSYSVNVDIRKSISDNSCSGQENVCEPVSDNFCLAQENIHETSSVCPRPHVVFLAPQGEQFCDKKASELSTKERLLFICGHYEGIDERVYTLADDIISIGDYVLTSGELASMVVIDAVVRKIPGVLGAEGGADDESFVDGLLEYPQYTRPAVFRGMEVPPVLLSGDHAKVRAWRAEQSLERTRCLRPDLYERYMQQQTDHVAQVHVAQVSTSLQERNASEAVTPGTHFCEDGFDTAQSDSQEDESRLAHGYRQLVRSLIEHEVSIATMESCTSGFIASLITDTEGSSAVYKGGWVTYSNEAKIKAGVPTQIIEQYGVYSPETALAMALTCREAYGTRIGIGVTGTFGNVDPANADSIPGEVDCALVWGSADGEAQRMCDWEAEELQASDGRLHIKKLHLSLPAHLSRHESKCHVAAQVLELLKQVFSIR